MDRQRCFSSLAALLLFFLPGVPPACLSGEVRTAVIGDYGADSDGEAAVATMIKTLFKPDLIVTAGDNNYGTASDLDRTIGQYFHAYIVNYKGKYGAGSPTNRFFPAIGDHDWYGSTRGYTPYQNFLSPPGNGRYYDFVQGPIHWYILNSDQHEPDGTWLGSAQSLWLSNRLAVATESWKIVVIHDPPYSSGSGLNTDTPWPYKEWGATALISGDAHNYERLEKDGFPYFVNGAGGEEVGPYGYGLLPWHVAGYTTGYGAMLIKADENRITFDFYAALNGGRLIDHLVLERPRLQIGRLSENRWRLTWSTNAPGYIVEESGDPAIPASWVTIPNTVGVTNQNFILDLAPTSRPKFFRLRKR